MRSSGSRRATTCGARQLKPVDRQMSPLVQIALIDFLVKTNERQSAPTLRRLAQDPRVNDAVRSRAAWGLQQLG
jgi:hypothetical protein